MMKKDLKETFTQLKHNYFLSHKKEIKEIRKIKHDFRGF